MKTDVVLISMPFGPINTPSLGLSLLNRGLKDLGIKSEIKYFNIEFSKQIDLVEYVRISNGFPVNHDLLGEWLFSTFYFSKEASDLDSYFNEVLLGGNPSHNKKRFNVDEIPLTYKDELNKIINAIPQFIKSSLEEIRKTAPVIVGFTSVFQQHIASLCLAREIKLHFPAIQIVFGGANVESVMGLENIKLFQFIDFIVSGEGDVAFPTLVKSILNGDENIEIPGVFSQHIGFKPTQRLSTDTLGNMDEIPIPNYEDFFTEMRHVKYESLFKLRLLFESSRGCWWGERHHCTFCGLNGETMKHRSKSYKRVISELEHFRKHYDGYTVSVVDNILDMGYFKNLIPEMKEKNKKYDLFYEVKSNLKKHQLEALSDIGIRMIQPGIESLSTDVLKEMNKGVTALQNIQLLKWSKEVGILPIWNFLWGFPNEDPGQYEYMATFVDKIFHLSPPKSFATIRIDRFSPNHFDYRAKGYDKIFPYPSYEHVYSGVHKESIKNLAYFFDYESKNKEKVPEYTKSLVCKIREWNLAFEESELFYVDFSAFVLICDTRTSNRTRIYRIGNLYSNILKLTDRAIPYRELISILTNDFNFSIFEIEQAIDVLAENDLIILDDSKVLSLVILLNERYRPSPQSLKKMYDWLSDNVELNSNGDFVICNDLSADTPTQNIRVVELVETNEC